MTALATPLVHVRDWGGALLLAVVVHLVAGLALLAEWQGPSIERDLIKPPVIPATLVRLKAEAPPPRKAPAPQPAPVRQPEPRAETPPQPAPRVEPDPAPVSDPEPEVTEPEPTPVGPTREQQALAREGFLEALEAEAEQLEAQQDAALVASHQAAIRGRIEKNWSRPPSARNGMEAELLIELVPTGDVVSVTVVRGSGNSAFDRSAELAVRKARSFEVPMDPALFERNFRRFRLLFRPEDLMR